MYDFPCPFNQIVDGFLRNLQDAASLPVVDEKSQRFHADDCTAPTCKRESVRLFDYLDVSVFSASRQIAQSYFGKGNDLTSARRDDRLSDHRIDVRQRIQLLQRRPNQVVDFLIFV